MKNPEYALVADNVCVQIGDKKIVHHCSFTATRGEFIGIIGPNGAGKSTLLKSLRGMLPVSAGEVKVFNHPIHRLGDKNAARLVAYMQQEVNVGFGFTALEVVLAGRYPYLKWWENERDADRQIAEKYMAFTGVTPLAHEPVNQVSGGERQRILLAKVLAQETPLIFLDEPTASLDLVYQEEIFRYCQTICKEEKSVFMIAHDIRLAAKFCSRLILLAHGQIVADGAPSDVLTVENLEKAYGLHSAVFFNKVTGNLDIHTYAMACNTNNQTLIHLIGGGGSTGTIMRGLYEGCYQLSAGVLQMGDTDTDVAIAFGIDCVLGQAFSQITELQLQKHKEKISQAHVVILGNLCYGEQNLDNLAAAFFATRLIVIEDTPITERDFTKGKATALYQKLMKEPKVQVMTSETLLEKIKNNEVC
ncbi:ABC transporter ATP-binding protein [Pelosinus sp. sgz500959]|uniref:ABC transporter ATP-binding protein n=1 Tax=Pelosinus sp. sgz500959 TaxID=3242472 RepID=UPI00366F037C